MAELYDISKSIYSIKSPNMFYFNHATTKINKKFMLIVDNKNTILIYDFIGQSFLGDNISSKDNIYFFDFHCKNENILFVCTGKNIIFYEIKDRKIIYLSKIEGHFTDAHYGCFNSVIPNYFLSVSGNDLIKIYDITNSFPISLINLKDISQIIYKIKFCNNNIGFIASDSIIYFEYLNFKKEKINIYNSNEDICDFHFLNDYDDTLIVNKSNKVEIIKNKKIIKSYELKEDDTLSTFYFKKGNILIIIYINGIIGIMIKNLENNYKMEQIFHFKNYIVNNIVYINENYLYSNEICEIFQSHNKNIFAYLITNNNEITLNNNQTQNSNDKILVQNIKKFISDIPLLLAKNNNIESSYNNINYKKYYEIESISKELEDIKKRNFIKRKEKVLEDIKKYDNIKSVDEKYIHLLKLLVNDNTNKEVVEKYLDLLKNKKNVEELKKIHKDKFENFEDELKYYSKIFTKEEIKSKFDLEIKSQKEEFYEFLKSISDLDTNNENCVKTFENQIKSYENDFELISLNNIPIDFSNEELYYYRNINILKYYLKNLSKKLKKKKEEKMDEINKNQPELTDVQKNETLDKYNKEIITSELDKLGKNINTCIDYCKQTNNLSKINEIIISLINALSEEEFITCFQYIQLPEKNIDLLLLGTTNAYITYFRNNSQKMSIELNLIKSFYKHILPLQCFKSIFMELNGKDSYYPFDDIDYTNKFIEQNFEILDIPIEDPLGLTDKFTMKTYFKIFIEKKNYKNTNANNIIEYGITVKTGNHEIGHDFTNFKFYMENSKISSETPRKNFFDSGEGGQYVDLALFGQILETMNLGQILYILNEDNYKKSYLDFQFGFKNLKKEDLIVQGTFKDICKNISIDLNEIIRDNNELTAIKPNVSSRKKGLIYCGIKNDVLGKIS